MMREPGAEAWAALRRTTEALAHEIARPSDRTPEWSEDEWLIARAAASMHGVSPLLARTSKWRGPPGWQAFLDEQLAHTIERHARIEALLKTLGESGIALVALKGPALHALELYRAGERPMADIDLLARDEDAERTTKFLERLGFSETYRYWKNRIFERQDARPPEVFGEHAGNVLKIDLHTCISEKLPMRAMEITELVFPQEPRAGINPYPSHAVLLTHLLLHAAGSICVRALRLLHMIDIARLCAVMAAADWEEFLRPGRSLWWAFPPLALTARYFDSVPERVLEHEVLVCSRPLRYFTRRQTLTDVSLSNPRLTAFPGIEWAGSVAEALAYVKSRVAPDDDAIVQRKYLAQTQPSLRANSWQESSQGRRMLRWMIERPPRPEPLFALRTALNQCREARISA